MHNVITHRKLTERDNISLVESIFLNNTSKHVAPPTQHWFDYVTSEKKVFCVVHFLDSNPIAITQFEHNRNEAYVSVFVKESEQGKGFFNQILSSAITELPKEVSVIRAYLSDTNHASIAAFSAFGFKDELTRDKDGLLVFSLDLRNTRARKEIFTYDKQKDIWCLLNKGKSSNNSPNPTQIYSKLVEQYGPNPSEEDASLFIDNYFKEKGISPEDYVAQYAKEWGNVASEYHRRAESIFGTSLPKDITVYLTINNRNPYSIDDNSFYTTLPLNAARKIVMHELWHFYTWYGLGADQEEKLGAEKYNELKEALTVLLNEECGDLMPEGISDRGYPQHKELRERIVTLWQEKKDIAWIWNQLTL